MKRPAFTLLEVLLATAVGVLLLSALYVAVNTHLRLSQTAREVVEHSALARTLMTRIGSDIRANLGPVPPVRTQQGAGATTATSTTGTAGTTGTTGTTSTTATTTSATQATSLLGPVQFNLGIQGDATRLVLYVSRIHRDPRFRPELAESPDELAPGSDLRRITYWLAGGGDAPLGLARQVVQQVTSEELMSALPPDVGDEAMYVLAAEVRSLSFSFFDGTQWLDTWDGTQVGADGMTPVGPPVAIAIMIGIAGGRGANVGPDNVKVYRHVVMIPTANGLPQQ